MHEVEFTYEFEEVELAPTVWMTGRAVINADWDHDDGVTGWSIVGFQPDNDDSTYVDAITQPVFFPLMRTALETQRADDIDEAAESAAEDAGYHPRYFDEAAHHAPKVL